MKKIIALLSIVVLSSCAHVNSLSLTNMPAQRDNQVNVESSKIVFFGVTFDTDYVEEIVDDLKEKCPSGKVQGILTKDETVNYFIGIVTKRVVKVSGYCVKA